MSIQYANADAYRSFCHGIHPHLAEMLLDISRVYGRVVVTSSHRRGDKGVHGCIPSRGVDIRSRGFNPEGICRLINRTWTYDPERPDKQCALYHDMGRGPHIHLQCHPNTIKKGAA